MNYSKTQLKAFFNREENLLKENYPGLNWKRLESDWEVYKLNYPRKNYRQFIELLKKAVPLEYITGLSYFYKSEFLVTPEVLIPRNETEALIEMALQDLKEGDHILDIGTGSGSIAITIANESLYSHKITATDISPSALEVAKLNSYRQRYRRSKETVIEFIEADRLDGVKGQFDLILSNPPYIKREKDKGLVHQQVYKYEPHLALFLDDNEYETWFNAFFSSVSKHLNDKGSFLMEGHEDHLNDLALLAKQNGLHNVKILPDLTGARRFLRANKLED